jgi:hypothetical protein
MNINEDNKITYYNFNRKGTIKKLKQKLYNVPITCRFLNSNKTEVVNKNNRLIIELVNNKFLSEETYQTSEIYYLLNTLQEYLDFITEFSTVVFELKNETTLIESHDNFIKKQNDIINKIQQGIKIHI